MGDVLTIGVGILIGGLVMLVIMAKLIENIFRR